MVNECACTAPLKVVLVECTFFMQVINHLDRTFVTADAATVCTELEVAHPAARMMVLATKMQENEVRAAPAAQQHAHTCTCFVHRWETPPTWW